MNVDDFLAEQIGEGRFDSRGAFTLDLANAAERLTRFKLPSSSHYLLKMLQLADRLGATQVDITMERFRTVLHFRAPRGESVTDIDAIYQAFSDPLKVEQPKMRDLVSALFGCLGETTLEVLWSASFGHRGRRVKIRDHQFTAETYELSRLLEPGQQPYAFTLSILHPKNWKFWETPRRFVEARQLLTQACALSPIKIFVDRREVFRYDSNLFVTHRRREGSTSGTVTLKPYHIASYHLASRTAGSFAITRPALANYLVRDQHFNVWGAGNRVTNTLTPDGTSSPAWIIQFQLDGSNISMRSTEKRVHCRALIAYDELEASNKGPFRLTIVRRGVILMSENVPNWAQKCPEWHGCHLMIANDTLPTDLTGFQVIQDTEFKTLLESHIPLLENAKEFFAQGRHLVSL